MSQAAGFCDETDRYGYTADGESVGRGCISTCNYPFVCMLIGAEREKTSDIEPQVE